jgi:probable addiction module antidote protein
MNEKFLPYDPADALTSDEAIEVFMNDAFKTDNTGYIVHAIGVAARAKGMSKIAGETGLAREALYRSFSEEGNPSLKSTIAVLKSLGFTLSIRSLAAVAAERRAMSAEEDGEPSEAAE